MKKEVVVDCPACGRKTPFDASNRWRPFCSQRCKSLDLGAWAAERYRINGEEKGEGGREKGEGLG
ncbi:MAG: DNA gyrase inhibitor YacG [Burkholderiaceae bacterium]|jgi:endogenous inhibitor of DNA gyrase (YacG/DUF329 family)|nr:DNA gyrase inhibitor YacG [Burkholderiaceae bacterium]